MMCSHMPWMRQDKVHPEPFRWIVLAVFLAALAFAIYATVLR
jgi:hypothetical protein